jgi:hypothetical protein
MNSATNNLKFHVTHGRNEITCGRGDVATETNDPFPYNFKGKNETGFNVYGSGYLKYIPIYIQQDATLHSLFISGNCSTCFAWYFHPSSGAHTTVSTASGICQTVTAICRYSSR